MNAPLEITLISCAVLGFRHGFDYDQIAAISDITSIQEKASTAMRLGLFYALGHASIIAQLGGTVILFQLSFPPRLDSWAERLVGLTLIGLAIYVLGSLVWGNPKAIPSSRAVLIIRRFRTLQRRLASTPPAAAASDQKEHLSDTGPIAFGVGVIHRLGAKTPSQLALFLLAANLGGIAKRNRRNGHLPDRSRRHEHGHDCLCLWPVSERSALSSSRASLHRLDGELQLYHWLRLFAGLLQPSPATRLEPIVLSNQPFATGIVIN
jgi:hypothetical protein